MPWVETDRGPLHLRCAGLGAVDAVCAQLAEHTDQLATFANERDDGALVRLALDASAMCSRLHRAYSSIYDAAGCEVEP